MMQSLSSVYKPGFLKTIVYMLQSSEYNVGSYLQWLHRTHNFQAVMYRRTLHPTKAARMLLAGLRLVVALQLVAGGAAIWFGMMHGQLFVLLAGWMLVILYPYVVMYACVVPLILGRYLIIRPRNARAVTAAEAIFANSKAAKIAIVGSYGKTSMKELLLTVLGSKLKVAATPANQNVAVSHANFAKRLQGDEDVILIEYGEGAPGDVVAFAKNTHPTHAVITGLAPAHLDQYKTLAAAATDIFSVADVVPAKQVYVNADSPDTAEYIRKDFQLYDHDGALGWEVTGLELAVTGTSFTLSRGKRELSLRSGLLGAHAVGPLSFAAALAAEYGLTDKQIEAAIATTQPHEHRMQPYQNSGAWIIDDTYNGNIEGIRAGTELLAALEATRKIYVTPGLVDQGSENHAVHRQMGKLIAAAQPDIVVLMHNSVTNYIAGGLAEAGYSGDIRIENDPLHFYTNLNHFVAYGDVVMMQNDWPDNYK